MSVKSDPRSTSPQLNLTLLDRAPAKLLQDEQQELALALVELLVNAAAPNACAPKPTGDPNESETHE
jgi:hypothetical protein